MKLALKICGILLCTTGSAGQAGFDTQIPAAEKPVVVPAITYSKHGEEIFVPLRQLADTFGWTVNWDEATEQVLLDETPIDGEAILRTPDRTAFIRFSVVKTLGVNVARGTDDGRISLWNDKAKAVVELGEQLVEINLGAQELRAFQSGYLIMRTNVSSGRRGYTTPSGSYRALGKARHRVSRKYNNAPMPYSVQVVGGVFIHGSGSVPRRPASHGCIRMPLTGRNAAREFFEWVNVGAKIKIGYDWSEQAEAVMPSEIQS